MSGTPPVIYPMYKNWNCIGVAGSGRLACLAAQRLQPSRQQNSRIRYSTSKKEKIALQNLLQQHAPRARMLEALRDGPGSSAIVHLRGHPAAGVVGWCWPVRAALPPLHELETPHAKGSDVQQQWNLTAPQVCRTGGCHLLNSWKLQHTLRLLAVDSCL
jgi:hypothetical protein